MNQLGNTTIQDARTTSEEIEALKIPSRLNAPAIIPQAAPAGGSPSKRGVRFVRISYDDSDGKKVETEVDEGAVSQSHLINSDEFAGRKATVKYDIRGKTTEVFFDDSAIQALVVLATRHLRITTEDTLEAIASPFCDFVYSWDNLENLSELKAESAIVKELYEKINNISSHVYPYGTNLGGLKFLKDKARLIDRTQDLKLILSKIKESPSMQPYFLEDKNPYAGSKKVYWAWIWTLFVPGELVLYTHPKDPKRSQVMIVRWDNDYESILSDEQDDDSDYEVPCWAYDWDPEARLFKLVSVDVSIERFHEAKSITSLDIFPLKFLDTDERQKRMEKFVERGKRFHNLCTRPQRLICNGKILPRTRATRQDWSFRVC